jgi:hypothetical protein
VSDFALSGHLQLVDYLLEVPMRYFRPLLILGTAMLLVAFQAHNGASPAAATVGIVQSNAKLEAHSFDGQGTVNPSVVKVKNNFAEFNDDVFANDDLTQGRAADGHGIQLTTIDTSESGRVVIDTNGSARASWLDADPGDGKDPNGQARSELTVTVEVTGTPAPYTIAGTLSATASGAPLVCASALLTAPEGVSFLARAPGSCGQGTQEIDREGVLPVGTHTFAVSAIALVYNGDSGGGNEDVRFDLLITIGSEPVVEGIEFTQGIQELQTVSELQSSLGGGAAASPQAFPGTNGKIAFYTNRNIQDLDLYLMDSNGANQTLVDTLPIYGSANPPSWSPDGQHLAFTVASGGLTQVFVGDFNGSTLVNIRNVSGTSAAAFHLSWLPGPGGQKLVFLRGGQILAADINNIAGATTLTFDRPSIENPAWSPDGNTIAHTRQSGPGGVPGIYLMDASGGNIRPLTTTSSDTRPEWSPDGSKITFTRTTAQGELSVMVVNADGSGTPAKIYSQPVYPYPVWSPDGSMIVFSRFISGGTVVAAMNPDGTGVHNLTNSSGFVDSHPAWQPLPQPVVSGVEFTQAIQELQTVSELQSDLAGDGKPPVPIIANKPLAMRVYLGEVDSSSAYTVKVTGEIDQEINVTLNPGCTADDRRKQVNNCESVDFYFTPPEGNWNVRVVVTDQLDALVFDETFNLTSVKTDDVTLKAVSVCDSEGGPGGTWLCQDAFPLIQDASLMRRMFPTADVKVIVTGDVIRRNELDYSQTIRWWGQVNRDLDALHSATDEIFGQQGTEIYYYGLVRNDLPGNSNGTAYIDTRAGASRPGLPDTVAHEVGHAMGLDHTDTAAPALSGGVGCWLGTRDNLPPYPYTDNRLRSGAAPGQIEVGFDVASGVALNGELFFDVMGYCESAAPQIAPDITRWITPFSTLELMSPNGPLSTGPVTPQAAPASTPGDFWLVQGSSNGASPNFVIDPLITLQGEGPTGPGAGTHRIEVRDGANGILFTRMFTPSHGHGSPSPGEAVLSTGSSFAELIPVQAGAASIQVFDALQTLVATVDLTGAAPTVDSITLPASFAGNQTLSWAASDSDSSELAYLVDYSPDGGQTWQSQAIGLTETSLVLDFDKMAASDGQGVFRVRALDGAHSGEATSAAFTVTGKLPHVEITGPTAISFRTGELVWLEAMAYDIDDGTLDDGAVSWSSSVDGALGTGASLPFYDLSPGSHTITVTATDSDNNVVTDSLTVTVSSGPIVEGGVSVLWGNTDCSADGVKSRDAQAVGKFVLQGTPLVQTEPCPDVGQSVTVDGVIRVWGNWDCSLDGIRSRDAQASGKLVLQGTPLTQTQPCPAVGASVTLSG